MHLTHMWTPLATERQGDRELHPMYVRAYLLWGALVIFLGAGCMPTRSCAQEMPDASLHEVLQAVKEQLPE